MNVYRFNEQLEAYANDDHQGYHIVIANSEEQARKFVHDEIRTQQNNAVAKGFIYDENGERIDPSNYELIEKDVMSAIRDFDEHYVQVDVTELKEGVVFSA